MFKKEKLEVLCLLIKKKKKKRTTVEKGSKQLRILLDFPLLIFVTVMASAQVLGS